MQGTKNTYWGNIKEATTSLLTGLRLSIRHFFEAKDSRKPYGIHEENYFDQQTGIFTVQYPKESIPVPDNGRYRLHNEIDDCIVCDKCAKICPVDCIDIEPVKAVEEIGKTSDGTPKRIYAAKFDIDMGKCCFCGLCTTVCPTECLTMTKAYDFSEYDVADHVYAFAEMTPLQILEKKQELERLNKEKELAKAAKASAESSGLEAKDENAASKPSFKPRMPIKPKLASSPAGEPDDAKAKALEMMKAKMQQASQKAETERTKPVLEEDKKETVKPVFKPRIPVKPKTSAPAEENKTKETPPEAHSAEAKPSSKKPVFKPRIPTKPQTSTSIGEEKKKDVSTDQPVEKKPAASKPVFRPRVPLKPKINPESKKDSTQENKEEDKTQGQHINQNKDLETDTSSGDVKTPEENLPEAKENVNLSPKPKPVFKPRPMIKKNKDKGEDK